MFVSADTMALLVDMGVTGEKLVELFRALERDAASVAPVKDEAAERRRAADRERKRQERAEKSDVCGHSADMSADEPLSPSPSPQTPQPRPHTRGNISSRARKGRPGDPVGFDEFWAIYPNRAARKDAVRAFTKALDAIPDEDALAVILAGVRRALPGWEGTETRFIPHAASWLNAERWNDPPPPPRIIPTSPRNDRPDRFAAKQANLESAFAGAEWADQVLAARRAF